MGTKKFELTFKCKNSIFMEEHKPESELIESVKMKQAPHSWHAIDKGTKSLKSKAKTGKIEIEPRRDHDDVKFLVNVKVKEGSGWFVQDI